jgi:hypothetical protein
MWEKFAPEADLEVRVLYDPDANLHDVKLRREFTAFCCNKKIKENGQLSVYHQNEAVQFLQRKLQDNMEKAGRVCMSNTIRHQQDIWYGTNAKRIKVLSAMNKAKLDKMDLH